MSALLHRNYRVSESWRKRPRGASETLSLRMLDASKRGQMRRKGAYSEADLLAVARKLYNIPDLQFRVPGQRNGVLAVMGPQLAEQVVLVIGTGSGKTIVVMIGAAISSAGTTILVLLMVALRVSKQQLDRIVIDESHLTITASDYRLCMAQLGWYVRQIRTQIVWLIATLPPVMQEEFIEHNKLVKPRVIRESTNRPNIKYIVSLETGPGALIERAANLVHIYWPKQEIFDHSRDKIIIYCRTREEVAQLIDILKCPSYTSRSGTEEEKAIIISGWLESGRAGRDGSKASSIVLLHAGWKPQVNEHLSADREVMQLYLTQQYCSRGILSQFLDDQPSWRWYIAGEEACQVCREPHTEARPLDLKFELAVTRGMQFTGPDEVLRQDHIRDQVLNSYERDLEVTSGNCLYYRTLGPDPEHEETECRFPDMVMPLCYGVWKRSGGIDWLQKYFRRTFKTELEYMLWLGETASLQGNKCIQANCVAALALTELG
ncbi:hypothetical protein BGZ57DRAFT_968235 [Hyaloscypha finlandica]|nr:hypothetical protein BGZ57DRAFT_968235 [Hyaloscypha finlandica]